MYKCIYAFFEGRERILDAFESKIFSMRIEVPGFSDKVLDHSNLKTLTPKQKFQRLPTALAQVKTGTKFENLLNGIRKIIYSVYWVKEIAKKV